MSDPDYITIVVHSAKGLQGKKPGRHKYSVIFGLGGTKFRTAVVKEPNGNPVWNEETKVHVTNVLDQVFLIVTEKDDILGHITIPVTSLSGIKGQSKTAPLQPHKRCPNPQGFISYQCYVANYRAPGDHLPVIKNVPHVPEDVRPRSAFQRLRKRIASPSAQKQISKKEEEKVHKGSLSNLNKKISKSIQDLFSFNKFSARDNTDIDKDNVSMSSLKKNGTYRDKNKKRFSLSFLSMNNDLDKTGTGIVITDCIPNSGPIDRPTRLTIEGRNLAIGKSDILLLKVAGCDCTDTVEFESSNRIYCTTHFWKVCKGPVEIDSVSSGKGILKDGFSFYEELNDNDNSSLNPFDIHSDNSAFQNESQVNLNIGRKEIKSGSSTVPRIKHTALTPTGKPPIAMTPHYQRTNGRRPSEATSEASYQTPKIPIEHVSKEELQAKIDQLEQENAVLKKDNEEMKRYIDKLVAKCIEHCPEALAQEDDERTKLFVLV